MAFLNKFMGMGRLTRDAEPPRTYSKGRLIKLGVAIGRSKKNPVSGAWEDGDTLFLDVTFFGGERTDFLIDRITENGRKGAEVYVEGTLKTESWDDKNNPGVKRSKTVLIATDVQFLNRQDQGGEVRQQQTTDLTGNSYDPIGANAGGNSEVPW